MSSFVNGFGGGSSTVRRIGMLAILAALCPPAAAQSINLSGTWVGNGGSQTTYTHNGAGLSGKSWGGPNNPNLHGSTTLSLVSRNPDVYRGTYEGRIGNIRGWGEITVTVCECNKMFVSYKGIVTDGRVTQPVQDSGHAVRK